MGFLATWRNKPVLVTGGTGFIGRQVLALGLEAGVDIANLSAEATAPPGIKHFLADIGDVGAIRSILQEVKPVAILHLAAGGVSYGKGSFAAILKTNTLKLEGLLKLASTLKPVPQIVLAGSGFEYGSSTSPHTESEPPEPFSPYGVSKAAATLIARLYARRMPITVLRPFSVYGTGEQSPRLAPYIIESALRGEPVALTQCEQLRDYTHVTDIAAGFWRALVAPHQAGSLRVVNLASGHAISLRIFVETLATQLKLHGIETDLQFGAIPYRQDEPMTYLADVSLMQSAFRWKPSVSLQDGLDEMVKQAVGNSPTGRDGAALAVRSRSSNEQA